MVTDGLGIPTFVLITSDISYMFFISSNEDPSHLAYLPGHRLGISDYKHYYVTFVELSVYITVIPTGIIGIFNLVFIRFLSGFKAKYMRK